jgi:hypothetical protein
MVGKLWKTVKYEMPHTKTSSRFFRRSQEWKNLLRLLLINVLYSVSGKLYSIQFQTALERYKSLIESHPDILLRAPLGHVASYLGITQQTLSVIRSER